MKLKRRRVDLAHTLSLDLTQPLDWDGWLSAASSIDEIHATCPHPGWLVYCGYFADVPMDTIFEAALAVATLAAEGDPRSPVSSGTIKSLDDLDGPALEQLILDLEARHPLSALIVEQLPSQGNWGMMHVHDARRAVRDQGTLEPPDLTPFRRAPAAVLRDEADALVAAGYVCTVETVYHHWQKLRETLAIRAAAAASLLCGSFSGFHAAALAKVREVYRWSR